LNIVFSFVDYPYGAGISVKTQELRLLVFVTRYLDLFTTIYSVYNSCMKVFYIAATAGIIIAIKYSEPFKSLYNFEQDQFPHWKYCVVPCFILALVYQIYLGYFRTMEILWRFSIFLESVAILPQLFVLRRYRLVENLTGKFVFFLGLYRILYIGNWVYRTYTEPWYRYWHHYEVYTAGVVQGLLYLDFYYQYLQTSRCCGFARGEWIDRRSTDGANDDDNDDETGLVFEVFDQRDVSSGAMSSTLVPLIDNSEGCRSRSPASNDSPLSTHEDIFSNDGPHPV